MRKSLVVPVFLLGTFAALFAEEASASPTYPRVVASTLGMECEPQCVLCHQTVPGRAGNASQSFALELRGRGLGPQDPESLRVILGELLDESKAAGAGGAAGASGTSSASDSDSDGQTDLEELTASPPRDPNGRANEICAASIEYGCEVSRHSSFAAPKASSLAFVFAFVVFGAFSLRRRRAR
jgi:hypothetical protein